MAEHNILMRLTMKQILTIVGDELDLGALGRRNKKTALLCVAERGTPDLQSKLLNAANAKTVTSGTKRKLQDNEVWTRRTKVCSGHETTALDADTTKYFLVAPSAEVVKSCFAQFRDATSNAALNISVCGVCAGEIDGWCKASIVDLSSLPGADRLIPSEPHPQHDLYDGKLLEPRGVSSQDGRTSVSVCSNCMAALQKENMAPPPFSLANNMWIGRVPWQLSVLTVPEQLLIARLYPRVYVFKLFPKGKGVYDTSRLQRGMRGNVSTYELDTDGITSMLKGNLMPQPPSILASVVTVTYVGVGKLPKNWLRSTFRVRRAVVLDALRWLKANNSRYYGDIVIDETRLAQLPVDDVPEEIISVIQESNDLGAVVRESAGYVPDGSDDLTSEDAVNGLDNDGEVSVALDEEEADVIPLHVSGVVDTDLSKLSANELMKWGFANLWNDGQEGAYAVRHGKAPVSDFGRPMRGKTADPDRPNLFEQAFPCLYPYGTGGIESDRPTLVDFREHVQWSLRYHDRRFRKHESFPFLAFGISQRWQSLFQARLQIQSRTFESQKRLLSTLTLEQLEQAQREEENNLPISSPVVRLLRQHVFASAGRVQGSDQSRYRMRSEIFSTTISLNPPSLWLTINPCDLHDPIAQIFAGEEIDMDAFLATLGPSKSQRALNIAQDPYAAAKFFHFMIKTIIATLFQVEVTPVQVRSREGIFGYVSAYFGTVESQGRATLHLHMLLWLRGAPCAERMRELLQTDEFRARVSGFIKANIRAYLPGLESLTSVKKIPNKVEIAYSRPPDPASPNFNQEVAEYELHIARAKQLHTCDFPRCLVSDGKGHLRCKRRAPFPCSGSDFINTDGQWGCERHYGYMNGWCPSITVAVRCNNDLKLLTNGPETKASMHYCSTYASKKQGRNHNMSALMARGYAYHIDREDYQEDLRERHRKMLFRLVHSMNQEQELAGPMVISYLMSWGDTYRSHHYTVVYWSSFVKVLLQAFPDLVKEAPSQVGSHRNVSDEDTSAIDPNENEIEEGTVTLEVNTQGLVYAKSQVTDYVLRGARLEGADILSYFVDSYEVDATAADEKDMQTDREEVRRGRKRNERVRYELEHPKHRSKVRIIRTEGHNNLPNIIGRSFPRQDDPENREYYQACMLMLVKPWRKIASDLKSPNETWEAAYNSFMSTATQQQLNTISNIQYLYESRSAADKERSMEDTTDDAGKMEYIGVHEEEDEQAETKIRITEDMVAAMEGQPQHGDRALLHAHMAVEVARQAKIFNRESGGWMVNGGKEIISNASGGELERLQAWRTQLEEDMQALNGGVERDITTTDKEATVTRLDLDVGSPKASVMGIGQLDTAEQALTSVDPSQLKPDQLRAYEIVAWHLAQTLAGREPPPLRMVLYGEGGTGKSKVIQTITAEFEAKGVPGMLQKAAFTGVAASLINGKTTHTIGMVSVSGRKMGSETKQKLQQFWKNIQYLIIDEISMISKSFLADLSRNIGIGKAGISTDDAFGGISVIVAGDFHQFPPVATSIREALFYPIQPNCSASSLVGRKTYESFTTVVVLREQVRVTDSVWRDFLEHLRAGRVQEQHAEMLRNLVLGHAASASTDFQQPPWNAAALVTPRHAVRELWNESASRKHCHEKGVQLFQCRAEDTIKSRPLTISERYALASRHEHSRQGRRRNELPDIVEMAIGMKVMVTSNIATDLDITNGARGEITDIVLHPDEPEFVRGQPIVQLKLLPVYLLVKLERTRAKPLEGLEASVIPVEAATQTLRMKMHIQDKTVQRSVRRRQYPMTPAYAFTDYRAQGQTLPHVVVDIAKPPGPGNLTLFNLYVALSRSSGRATIRLLRDFDINQLRAGHDTALMDEDDRLDVLDKETKAWWQQMKTKGHDMEE